MSTGRTAPNRYREACADAATTGSRAVDALTSAGPHPLHAVLTTLQVGWVSGSAQRGQFEAEVYDLSRRLLDAFAMTAADLDGAAAREPQMVDPDNPAEAWKARYDAPRARAV